MNVHALEKKNSIFTWKIVLVWYIIINTHIEATSLYNRMDRFNEEELRKKTGGKTRTYWNLPNLLQKKKPID